MRHRSSCSSALRVTHGPGVVLLEQSLPHTTDSHEEHTPHCHLFPVVTGSVPALTFLLVYSALTTREDSSSLLATFGRTVPFMLLYVLRT